MKSNTDKKHLRSFGLTVGAIFSLVGLWPVIFYNDYPRLSAMVFGVLSLMSALVFPASLSVPYKGCVALGHVMGWINTRIILGVIFHILVTPIGCIRRLLGKDSMGKQIRPDADSYREIRSPRPASHLLRQF